MSIYSPQRKAIYLSPHRLDLLHRRRGLSDRQTKSGSHFAQLPPNISSRTSPTKYGLHMVGANGLEPSTSASRTLRATKLRYAPIAFLLYRDSRNLQSAPRARFQFDYFFSLCYTLPASGGVPEWTNGAALKADGR